MAKNFKRALKHLKSNHKTTKLDEKKQMLNEIPTMHTGGVYSKNPAGFRYDPPSPAKRFIPDVDGNWPAGVPGTPGASEYIRPQGYWVNDSDWETKFAPNMSNDSILESSTNTDGFIDAQSGTVKTLLPPNSRSFILGPLVDGYNYNHGYDDYTTIGYLQKDTRQFVLLATIQGHWNTNQQPDGRTPRLWDGTSGQFTAYNSNFTLAMAQWFKDRMTANDFTKNFPYFYSGGVFQGPLSNQPPGSPGGMLGGNAAGTGGGGNDPSDGDGKAAVGSGGTPDTGTETPQGDPEGGDPGDLNLWGLIKGVMDEIGDRFAAVQGVLDAIPPFLNYLAHQINENSPWNDENPFPVTLNEQETQAIQNDIKEIFNEWGNDRVDAINEGSPMTKNEQVQVNEKINADKTDDRGDALNAQYPGVRLTINNIGKPDAFKGNIQTNKDGSKTPIAINDNYVFEGDYDASAPGAPAIINFMLELPGVQQAIEKSGLDYTYRQDLKDPTDDYGTKPEIKNKNMPIKVNLTTSSSLLQSESLNLDRKRILREITQPLKEIKELPKTQKLEKYRPNFKGKYKAQNTPNVTASKKSDEMVKAKNAAGQTWRTKDKYWGGYQSQERMNVVYDNVGHGDQYWDKIVNENLHKKNIKNRKVQEELNIIAHEKAMRRLDSTFISPFKNIEEQETYDNKIKDPLFSKVADRLKKEIDYENKPAKKGYPNEAPPEMVNGFHPNYGKRYKYDKLDPQSAESMPVQGNPEIDANVQKALDKRAKNRKIKNLKIDAPTVENVSWKETLKKKNLEELKKGFKKFKQDLKEGMTTAGVMTLTRPAEGDTAIDTVSPIDAASFTAMADVPQPGDNNIANVGTVIRDSGTGSGEDGGFNVGGQYLAFQGTGDAYNNARFAALSPIDSSAVDTFSITAIVGNDVNGGEDPDLASEALFLMYKTPGMSQPMFLFQKPDGSSGEGTGTIINSPLSHDGGLNNYSIAIPEYARAKGTQFVLYQNFSSSAAHDNYGITQIKLQRRAPVNVVVPLDDPAAISFINVGTTEGDPKKRKKKVQDQLDASNEYVTSQFGDDFPTGANLTPDDDIQASPIGSDEVKKSFGAFQKSDQTPEVIKTPEQIKAQNDEYLVDLQNVLTRNEYDYSDPKIIEIADQILKTDPKNIDAYFYKLGAQYETGDMKAVLKTTDAMIKNNPDDPTGYEMRSYIKGEEGDLAGAIEDLEKAIELDPDSEFAAYNEMELADLKFQEAEVETNNAKRDRMESEAGAIEAKAHEDYWNNADLIEQEEGIEYEYVDDETLIKDFAQGEFGKGMLRGAEYEGLSDNERANLESGLKRQVASYTGRMELPEITAHNQGNFRGDGYHHFMFYTIETWKGTAEEFADYYAGLKLAEDPDHYSTKILYNNREFHKSGLKMFKHGQGNGYGGGSMNVEKIKNLSPSGIITEFSILFGQFHDLQDLRDSNINNPIDSSPSNIKVINAKLKSRGEYLQALSKALPEEFFEGGIGAEPINTLYDQMKALYDEEDPEKEIKTELKAQGYEKQYKDLMSAWDSADKFSKFITPLKNLGDALLGSKTAQNAKYENYKIAIAKSIMLNKPIRVNPDTIDPMLIKKLGDRITPNQILDYDEEQRYNAVQEKYVKASKAAGNYNPSLVYDYEVERMMSGEPVIPIVSEAVPYADENIYEDEFGRVFTNDGSVANTTFQPDKGYHGFAQGYVTDIMGKNPIAGRGQAQYQIVVPPDGTEPYLLYKDHAYHNVKSDDTGETPGFMNQGAAGFVNWLGNTAHARGDGEENTGGMAGYPPNIRGDVITQFRINLTDLPEDVQGAVYRHPLMTEQPELVQALKDTIYTDKNIKKIAGSKDLHNLYTLALKGADKLKDLAVDKGIELIMGLPSIEGTKNDLRSASNMLQRYDDYIQQTVYTPDGKTYVPGLTDADGNVISRIDVTDEFVKVDQNHLKGMFNDDEDIQKILKAYVKGDASKTSVSTVLQTRIGDIMNASNPAYRKVLANSLGKGTRVNVDEFLNGKIVLEKNFEFRDETVNSNWFVDSVAALFQVSTDTAAAGGILTSLATMTAARQLLRPVRGPGIIPGTKQTFAQAMNSAPTMPYKLEFDVSEKIMNILQGIESEEDKPEDDTGLGSTGGYVGGDATAAATAAAEKDKDKNKNKNESTLYKKVIGKTLLKS